MWSRMPLRNRAAPAALAALTFVMPRVAAAQTPPPQNPPATASPQTPTPPITEPGGRGQGRGAGRGQGPGTFPAQQRPPGDPAIIERGRALYSVNCTSCHGVDLRGGQLNGPNLLRSQLMLNDQQGELLLPIVQGARAEKGMPPLPLQPDDVKAVAAYIHSVLASAERQGGPPPGPEPILNVLVGDAAAGEAYFAAKCSSCHSTTGNLAGIATRFPDAKALQNFWVSGGRAGARGGFRGAEPPNTARAVTATITLPAGEKPAGEKRAGEKLEGRVVRYDDFLITLALEDGSQRTVRREGDKPKVQIRDPLEPHRALLAVYTDKDIHDVTAYLVTVK
jgi:cytochrome c oxidase cbb3-type subunit III